MLFVLCVVTQHGKTALHEALSSTGNRQIVLSLLLHGADPNIAPKVFFTTSALCSLMVGIVFIQYCTRWLGGVVVRASDL